jgi:hypothetical protein
LETVEELETYLTSILRINFRGSLSDRASAWSMMRVDGEPPVDSGFAVTIATDLAEYGFAVLRAALLLTEKQGNRQIAQSAFNTAGKAFESLTRNTFADDSNVGFYRVIAGASYHLAGYSAIAYSILNKRMEQGENNAPCEIALIYLILRDLDQLRLFIRVQLNEGPSDSELAELLSDDEFDLEDAISAILNNSICQGLAFFDLALATGNEELRARAKNYFRSAEKLAADSSTVTIWWVAKLTANLTDDLWGATLHTRLPLSPPKGGEEHYEALRDLFITHLYCRKVAEVELWPSQLEAADRCSNIHDDLIVALPTSAGKTRIAEMAALVTLSTEKRVLIVTPLRALSAQTERSFRKTFTPLGFTVSSLYGAGGLSTMDSDALNNRHIVIATPEKLDFALRNDASILNDIGLIILDEGHMIGKSEREIRFEILVQRLLKRSDASERRIVCLSAILPDGDNLSDLTEWMRSDEPGAPVKLGWRPTRQMFGTLEWKGESATLNYDHKKEQPFILNFIRQVTRPDQGGTRPKNMLDLTIFGAWAFAKQDKKTLVFITQANWVENFGKTALDLVAKGYLPSLLQEPERIKRCVAVGKEWLGAMHPAVKCLEIGVAIHHGNLPDPFLRELEILIAANVITVTIASPTLSQGLNINAAVLLVPYLHRAGEVLKGEEFANVAGRAGRAFVDVEGVVLHVIYDKPQYRKRIWSQVVNAARHRILTSGLMQIIEQALNQLAKSGVLERADAFEYLANSREAWFTKTSGGPSDELAALENDIDKLDAMILSLIEALDSNADDLPTLIDEALQGSLWERQIARETAKYKKEQLDILSARARLIWSNTTSQRRKEHFCMGVGLDTGLMLDAIADELNKALDDADGAALSGDTDSLYSALVRLCEPLFRIQPFKPDALSENWRELLKQWVKGISIDLIGPDKVPIIEDHFSYRLVWAIEAIRMRRLASGWQPESITGSAAACAENGVPQLMSALLIRAGLPSRRAAMLAITESFADFADRQGMREWIESDEVEKQSKRSDWPSIETAPLWQAFREQMLQPELKRWRRKDFTHKQLDGQISKDILDGYYRFEIDENDVAWMTTPDFVRIAPFQRKVSETGRGLTYIWYCRDAEHPHIIRYGEGKLNWY